MAEPRPRVGRGGVGAEEEFRSAVVEVGLPAVFEAHHVGQRPEARHVKPLH